MKLAFKMWIMVVAVIVVFQPLMTDYGKFYADYGMTGVIFGVMDVILAIGVLGTLVRA